MEIFPLAKLAPSSIPKIPSVSKMLKTTITNIINGLLKILIISPHWPFGPCFAQTLLISSHTHTSRLTVLAELKPTPNRTNLSNTIQIYIYIYMTQEAIKKPENKQK
jgi:hypothetical protein